MENKQFLEKLKFGVGDGNLQYYLYNWRCPHMPPEQVSGAHDPSPPAIWERKLMFFLRLRATARYYNTELEVFVTCFRSASFYSR